MKKKFKSHVNSKKSYIFYVIIFILLVYILFIDESSFIQRYLFKRKLNRLKADIESLEKDNERISQENKDLRENPKTWEKHARDLGMQKDDEETFIFKEDDK